MPLQVRLNHALGERLIDLEETGADRPIVVGRGPDAAVQVPSAGVGLRHCLLFVYKGRWAVQDGGSEGGTYLNGRLLKKPAAMKTGDVIALGTGTGAPSVTIDPHGLGTGAAPDEDEAGRVSKATPAPNPPLDLFGSARPTPAVPAQGLGNLIPRSPAVGPVAYGTPPPGYSPPPQVAPQATSDDVNWSEITADPRFYVPKRKSVSPVTMTWVVLLAVGALCGVVWAVRYVQEKQRQEQLARQPLVIVKNGPSTQPTSLPVQPSPPQTAPTTAAATSQPEPTKEPEFDPRREEESWKAVEQARFVDPVIGVVKFIDYLEQNPDTPFRKDVDKYVEEALDRIWWMRIKELFAEIDDANAQIATKQGEIKQSQDEQFKKGVEQEIKQWSEQRDRANDQLRNQMKYTAAEPPNLYDSARLGDLRSTRPEGFYKQWKTQVFDSIKRTRGQRLPWKQTK
jgi:hypothetical protein